MKFITLFLGILISGIEIYSQTIENVIATKNGDLIEINYDLQCRTTADIALYMSENGGNTYIGPLKSISGDVGQSITAGNKTIKRHILDSEYRF